MNEIKIKQTEKMVIKSVAKDQVFIGSNETKKGLYISKDGKISSAPAGTDAE